jgi:hypothetical protein
VRRQLPSSGPLLQVLSPLKSYRYRAKEGVERRVEYRYKALAVVRKDDQDRDGFVEVVG